MELFTMNLKKNYWYIRLVLFFFKYSMVLGFIYYYFLYFGIVYCENSYNPFVHLGNLMVNEPPKEPQKDIKDGIIMSPDIVVRFANILVPEPSETTSPLSEKLIYPSFLIWIGELLILEPKVDNSINTELPNPVHVDLPALDYKLINSSFIENVHTKVTILRQDLSSQCKVVSLEATANTILNSFEELCINFPDLFDFSIQRLSFEERQKYFLELSNHLAKECSNAIGRPKKNIISYTGGFVSDYYIALENDASLSFQKWRERFSQTSAIITSQEHFLRAHNLKI